jgi:hypothetical protein
MKDFVIIRFEPTSLPCNFSIPGLLLIPADGDDIGGNSHNFCLERSAQMYGIKQSETAR